MSKLTTKEANAKLFAAVSAIETLRRSFPKVSAAARECTTKGIRSKAFAKLATDVAAWEKSYAVAVAELAKLDEYPDANVRLYDRKGTLVVTLNSRRYAEALDRTDKRILSASVNKG